MSDTISVNPTPSSHADVYKTYLAADPWLDIGTLIYGSTIKGAVGQTLWFLFEPNLPADSTLVSVEMNLYLNSLVGTTSTAIPQLVGFLAGDGTWEVQTGNTGWDEYATAGAAPHPLRSGASDATWINNFPSFDHTLSHGSTTPSVGAVFSYGGGSGISPTYSDASFLSDAQDAFDAEEASRTARGVPLAIMIVPQNNAGSQWSIASNEDTTASRRPELVIVYDPPPIAAELAGGSSVAADLAIVYGAASELAGDADIDAAASLIAAVASELLSAVSADARLVLNRDIASELLSATVLDAAVTNLLAAAIELTAAATLDAAVRASETAADPLAVLYKLLGIEVGYASENTTSTNPSANAEVSYKALSVEITNPQANIEVTMPADNIEVGAD